MKFGENFGSPPCINSSHILIHTLLSLSLKCHFLKVIWYVAEGGCISFKWNGPCHEIQWRSAPSLVWHTLWYTLPLNWSPLTLTGRKQSNQIARMCDRPNLGNLWLLHTYHFSCNSSQIEGCRENYRITKTSRHRKWFLEEDGSKKECVGQRSKMNDFWLMTF